MWGMRTPYRALNERGCRSKLPATPAGPRNQRLVTHAWVPCGEMWLTVYTQCDGQRPVCTACVRRGSSCTFGGRLHDSSDSSSSQTPLPGDANRHNDAIELLTLLTSIAPEEEALDLLNEIKSCGDFSLALAQIKKGRTLDHEDEGPDFLWPPNQGSVEFELMVRHPILYPSDAALDSRLDPSRLYIRRVPESGKSNLLRYAGGFNVPFFS